MNPRILLMGLLIAALAYFVVVVPKMEGEGTVVPRASHEP
jgi:hypothetical protein